MNSLSKIYLFNENTVKKDIGVLLLNYIIPQKASANEDYSSLLLELDDAICVINS